MGTANQTRMPTVSERMHLSTSINFARKRILNGTVNQRRVLIDDITKLGPFHVGDGPWYLNILILIPVSIVFIILLIFLISAKFNERRYRKILPEAEVKI